MTDDEAPHGDPDLIWVRDIPEQFGVGTTWAYDWLAKGHLVSRTYPGDRKTYFFRSQIRHVLSTPVDQLEREKMARDRQGISLQPPH